METNRVVGYRRKVLDKTVKNRKKGKDGKQDRCEGKQKLGTISIETSEELQIPAKKLFPLHLDLVIKFVTKSEARIFLGLLLFRVANSLLIRTFFVPDEYWQSIEVAHKATFGYGYLTWEWRKGIRSYLYPFCFSCFFYLLKFLQVDCRFLVTRGPMFLQSFLAALADLYTYKTAFKLSFNHRIARWTLLCQLTSWYIFYSSTRTLTNSTEASLVAIALYFLPWSKKLVLEKEIWNTCMFIIISCLSVVLRPTALIIWMPLILWKFKATFDKKTFFTDVTLWAIIGSLILIASIFIDFLFYGQYTNVYYNFFEFNVISGISSIYGTHPWHWYFSQGFVVILSSHVVMLAVAIIKKHNPLFVFTILWTIIIYSFLPHKEFRFLSGLMPLSMHLCGMALHSLFEARSEPGTTGLHKSNHGAQAPKVKSEMKSKNKNECSLAKVAVAMALLSLNVPLAIYTCLFHQRGTIDVMSYLAMQSDTIGVSVLFLMPCHSTPYYSHIHKNITMKFLTCEPNLEHQVDYIDEADEFFTEPSAWLRRQKWMNGAFAGNSDHSEMPTHIVLFKSLYNTLSLDLSQYGFKNICAEFFHTHFPTDRVDSHVLVACR